MSTHFRRLSLAQGSSLCLFGVLVGLALLVATQRVKVFPISVLFILAAWFFLWFFSHDLAHHIVGRIVGVSFRYYFLGRSAIVKLALPVVSNSIKLVPVLGLKVDKSSLKTISRNRVRSMYASGMVSSMLLPWLVVPAGYGVSLPVGLLLTLLNLGNDLFTLYFSLRVGDLHKARVQSLA